MKTITRYVPPSLAVAACVIKCTFGGGEGGGGGGGKSHCCLAVGHHRVNIRTQIPKLRPPFDPSLWAPLAKKETERAKMAWPAGTSLTTQRAQYS